jgi:membrane protease subunit (stomatin/prohibitin family)
MATTSGTFLEVIEWFDPTGQQLLQRIPAEGSGDIKFGAQLTVRESQAAVLFYQGRAYDAFGPGRHTLRTANVPILTKLLSLPWGATSPLRAEVVFVNLKVFTNLKWGTRDPVAFKDSTLGLVRLRAFGVFNVRVVQPVLLINSLAGTQGIYTTDDIEEYLSRVIVSRFNDHLGEHLDSLVNLPGRYDELASGLATRLENDFGRFGLALSALYINTITPPPDVQKAIDDKSRMGVLDDMDKFVRMKAAMAMEKAAESSGGAAQGVGLGVGMVLPAIFGEAGRATPAGAAGTSAAAPATVTTCHECHRTIPADSRFCPACGHQLVVFDRCPACARELPPGSAFCPGCGKSTAERPTRKRCPHCGAEELLASVFCNQCGERIG